MPDVNLIDYSSQLAANARQQRMAELLQQQSMEPIQVMTAGGAQVPIPWTAVLAKVLQAGAGAYTASRAEKKAAKIKTAQDTQRNAAIEKILNPTRVAPGVRMEPERLAQLRAMEESVNPRPVRAAPIDATGMIPTATAMSGAASLPRTPANVAAALQNNVPPALAQQIPVSTAPLVTALGGTPPPAPTAMPSPVAMPPMGNPALQGNGEGMTPRAIAALRAENMRNQGPITPMAAPLVGVEGQSELDRPKTAAERQSEYLQAITSGDSILAAVGSNLYERGAKKEERTEEAKELSDRMIAALDASSIPASEKALYKSMIPVIGVEGVQSLVANKMKPDIREVKNPDGSTSFVDISNQQPPAGVNVSASEVSAPNLKADTVWSAMIQRESGGDGDAISPKGALGSTQMLPPTAQAMAKKLGVAYQPELMLGNSPQALAYQNKLGRAYFDEGLQIYKGDLYKAASYYHGGPNEAQWGPKTKAYAEAVTAGLPQEDMAAAPQRGIPGSAAQPKEWVSDGLGVQTSRLTGERKADPTFSKAGIAPPAGAGLQPLGNNYYEDKIGRVYQPNSTGVMQQVGGLGDTEVRKSVGTVTGINTTLAALDRYDDAVRKLKPSDFGPTGKFLGDPVLYAQAKAAATDLQMTLKGPDIFNLGVITGDDLAILEGVVQDPAKFETGIRRNQIVPQLRQLALGLGQKRTAEEAAFKALGGKVSGLPPLFRSPRSQSGKGVAGPAPESDF